MKLFTAIYDDDRILGHFLQHYRRAGVTDYFIATAPGFAQTAESYRDRFTITVYEGLNVADSWLGGASAVSAMRAIHHDDDEWAIIADLDEFTEFPPNISSIVRFADSEGANVVRGIMYDRFSADGRLVDFAPAAELSQVYPVRSRLTRDLMGGWDYKGVLVKGKLQPPPDSGNHLFVGEKICSREVEISHYKWNARAIDRVRAAYEALSNAGKGWAIEYRRVLDHYERNGRFVWEEFGGELVADRSVLLHSRPGGALSLSLDVLRPRPETVVIEVTSKCNLRCSYCPKADAVLQALPGANEDMTDAMIAGLYRHCKETGIDSVTLSVVGETTMHKGWDARVKQFLEDPEISTQLNSNFVRLFDDDDLLALTRLDDLQISIDSSDFAMMRKLRQADLRTISYNIIRLRQKAKEVGRCPAISVNCTLCRDNIGHIIGLASFCRELGADQLVITEVMPVGQANPKMPETLNGLSDNEVILLAEQISAAEDLLAGSGTGLRLQGHLHRIDAVIAAVRQGTVSADVTSHFRRSMAASACRQPWTIAMVRANGDVLPCCGPEGMTVPVGNVMQSPLPDILDGEAYRAIRASILDGRPIVSCHACSFAVPISFEEFRRDIEVWQRGPDTYSNVPSHPDQSPTDQHREEERRRQRSTAYSTLPLVSIVYVTYRHEKFARDALRGVLAQTYPMLDVIILDDASPDSTADIIAAELAKHRDRLDLRFVRNDQNLGFFANTRKGLALAQGDFIILFNGDDVMLPTMVEKMVEVWREHDVSLVTANARYIDESGEELNQFFHDPMEPYDETFETLARNSSNAVCFGAAMGFERSLYDEFGYSPDYLTAKDVLMPFYAYLCKGARFIPEPLLKYRVRAQNPPMTLQWERSKHPTDELLVLAEDRYIHLANAFLMISELERLAQSDPSRLAAVERRIRPLLNDLVHERAQQMVAARRELHDMGLTTPG